MIYKIIEETSIQSLEYKVNLMIENGWKPIGGVTIKTDKINNSNQVIYLQSILNDNKVLHNKKEVIDSDRKNELKKLYKKNKE